jgi:DNA-binding FadR family transcriptional regulator
VLTGRNADAKRLRSEAMQVGIAARWIAARHGALEFTKSLRVGSADMPSSSIAGVRHDEIAATLACEIISGARLPGSRMPSPEEMFDRFGVSRVLMREVTKTLTAKGMIVAKSKVGTLVLPPEHWNWFDADFLSWRIRVGLDAPFFDQLTEMRRAVEPMAAALAADRHQPHHLVDMRDALREMRTAGANRHQFGLADLRFHVAVGEASGNPFFRSFATVVETALAASLSVTAPLDEDRIDLTVGRHAAIADAIAQRDAAAAAQAMIVVIEEGAAYRSTTSDR